MDADVVDDGRGLQGEEGRGFELLAEADGARETRDLDEMLDTRGVAGVELDHAEHELVEQLVRAGKVSVFGCHGFPSCSLCRLP